MSYDPNNPYGQQQPPPPPPPGPGPVDSGATSVFQPQQPPPGAGYPPAPGAGYPQAPGGPPPGYGQQPPGYGQQPPGYGQQPPGGGPSAGQKLQQLGLAPQDWMILGSTVVMLIALLLDWYSSGPFEASGLDGGDDGGLFPLTVGFFLAGLLGAVPIIMRLLKQTMPPFLGLGTRESEGTIAILMVLGALSWLMLDRGDVDKGIGLWLTILAALVWAGGAIWRAFAPATPAPGAPPGGSGYPPSY
jgi:hypothetical protein